MAMREIAAVDDAQTRPDAEAMRRTEGEMRFQFGFYTLDLKTRELHCHDEPVELEPRTFDVLAHLARHRDRVVPKEELLDELWGDRFVTESALTSQIKHARQAVGDDGRTQKVIRTAHRVGYRFVADLDGEHLQPQGHDGTDEHRVRAPRTTRLVGREADLDTLLRKLEATALLTITGTGGVGKSSVSRCLLGRLDSTEIGGGWLCDLADDRGASAVVDSVLGSVGHGRPDEPEPEESMVRVLERDRGLLVLDNCDHVIDVLRPLVGRLRHRCPGIRVIATSRVPLGVVGESIYPLAPLRPADAKACYVESARARGATVDERDPAIDELCRRLDGLPLALELAAARARLLSPEEMLSHLDDRFRLLQDSCRQVDERHRSLRHTIARSWERLDVGDRDLLSDLAVFTRAFTLDDVRAVARAEVDIIDSVDALGRLTAASLVDVVAPCADQRRFRMLESVREFARNAALKPSGP